MAYNQSSLITHISAKEVPKSFQLYAADWPVWSSAEHPQTPPGSGCFPFHYNGDYATEDECSSSPAGPH